MDEHRTDRRASRYPVARAIRLKLEIRHICIARFGLPGLFRLVMPAGWGWLSRPPEDVAYVRRWQLMVLARYARQPLTGWADAFLDEIQEWVEVLVDVMRDEHPLATRGEDGG